MNLDTVAALVQFVSRSPKLNGADRREFDRIIAEHFPRATIQEKAWSGFVMFMALRDLLAHDAEEAFLMQRAVSMRKAKRIVRAEQMTLPGIASLPSRE